MGHMNWCVMGNTRGVEYQPVAMLQFHLRLSKPPCVQTGSSKEREQNNTRAQL